MQSSRSNFLVLHLIQDSSHQEDDNKHFSYPDLKQKKMDNSY